jgi:hypothetical protein
MHHDGGLDNQCSGPVVTTVQQLYTTAGWPEVLTEIMTPKMRSYAIGQYIDHGV